MRGPRHQIAEVVRDHEGHLAMGEDRGLGTTCRAGRVEKPARIVMLDSRCWHTDPIVLRYQGVIVLAEVRSPDGDHKPDVGSSLARGRDVFRKIAVTDHRRGAARLGEIGHLARGLTVVRRHPDSTEPERGEHRLEHLVAVLGLHQDTVALLHASRGQGRRHGLHPSVELGPCPGIVPPDEADFTAIAPRRLTQEVGEIHDPLGNGRNPARGSLIEARHLRRSKMDT